MSENKAIKILKSFSSKEMRLFARFVKSPVYNRHEGVIQLFTLLRKELDRKEVQVNWEKIFSKIFPGRPFKIQKIHHLNSYLLKVLEEFLSWNEWQREKTGKDLHLIRAYQKHQLHDYCQKNIAKSMGSLEKSSLRNESYYQNRYRLHLEQYKFLESQGRMQKFNLQELSDYQDIFFLAERLKNACAQVSHQSVSKRAYNTGLLPHILTFLEDHPYLELPAIGIYYYGYFALTDVEADRHFQKLKSLLVNHDNRFSIQELRDMYILAINCCIRRINLGRKQYREEIFDLYKAGLKDKAFVVNGKISSSTYGNIVVSGLHVKDYDWVYQFIYDYKKYLSAEGFFHFHLSQYYFERGDYTNAMPLMQKMEYGDVLLNIAARSMLARMYFELGEFEALEHLLRSFKNYIKRQKEKKLGYHRELYGNFVDFAWRLLKVNGSDLKQKAILRKDLKNMDRIASKEWLLKQIN